MGGMTRANAFGAGNHVHVVGRAVDETQQIHRDPADHDQRHVFADGLQQLTGRPEDLFEMMGS